MLIGQLIVSVICLLLVGGKSLRRALAPSQCEPITVCEGPGFVYGAGDFYYPHPEDEPERFNYMHMVYGPKIMQAAFDAKGVAYLHNCSKKAKFKWRVGQPQTVLSFKSVQRLYPLPSGRPTLWYAELLNGSWFSARSQDGGFRGDGGTPRRVKQLEGLSIKHFSGAGHGVFVLANGSVLGTGSNSHGELGLGDQRDRHDEFVRLPMENVVAAAAASYKTYLVDRSGKVWVAGESFAGGESSNVFTRIWPKYFSHEPVVFASAAHEHAVFLTSSANVYGVGRRQYFGVGYESPHRRRQRTIPRRGQGVPDDPDDITENPIKIPLEGVKQIQAGQDSTSFLLCDGTAHATGLNDIGQLGTDQEGGRVPNIVRVPRLKGVMCALPAPSTKNTYWLLDRKYF